MSNNQITRYGIANSSGGHNLGLRVSGIQILICPTRDEQIRAEQLAQTLADLDAASQQSWCGGTWRGYPCAECHIKTTCNSPHKQILSETP